VERPERKEILESNKKLGNTPPLEAIAEVAEERVVKISLDHYQMLQKNREEINRDKNFKKKISVRRIVEKLVEDFGEKCIPDLKKEREQSEDWLRLEHQKKAPDIPFFDWLKTELSKNNGREKPKMLKAQEKSEPSAVQIGNGGGREI
jgi:hypothetical protein